MRPCILAVSVSLAGCTRYEPKRLELDAHRAAWVQRDPASALSAFVEQLEASGEIPTDYDPSDGLSLAEAEIVALVFNPELRVARTRAKVAEATAAHAGLWEDPVFELDLLRIIESVPEPWILGTSLGFTIPLSGRLGAEKAMAAAGYQAALARALQAEWELLFDLRNSWLEWSSVRLQAEVTLELVERLERIVSMVDRLEQAGEIPRLESRLFRIEAATRSNDARVLQARAAGLELTIKALLGLRPESPVIVQPQVSLPTLPTRTEMHEQSLERANPLLAVARAEYDVAEQALRREIRKQYPDLGLGPAYGNEDDQSRIGFSGSLPIPLLNRNKQGIAEAEAEREASRAMFEARYEQLIQQRAQAELELRFREELRQDLESTLIPLVEDQVDDAQRMIDLGELDTLVQLESVVRQAEAKLRVVEARQAEAVAANRVRMLLGPEGPSYQSDRGANP
jgi:outer membrane protein TolC